MNQQQPSIFLPPQSASLLPTLPDNHDLSHLRGAIRILKENNCKFRMAIDGGAHRGIWSKELLKHFNVVYAFEPNTGHSEFLDKIDFLIYFPVALSKKEEYLDFSHGPHNDGQYHVSGKGKIKSIPLDILNLKNVDFLKLDIEGYELFALQGAEKIIERDSPAIMIEMNGLSERYDYTDDDLRAYLSNLGYSETGKWNKDYLFLRS